jgi:hypothetical protein
MLSKYISTRDLIIYVYNVHTFIIVILNIINLVFKIINLWDVNVLGPSEVNNKFT